MADMHWVYAKLNGRLAEILFELRRGKPFIFGHGYVKESWFRTAHEKRMIRIDTEKYHLTYRNKKYFDQIKRKEIPSGTLPVSPKEKYKTFSSVEELIKDLEK